MFLQAKQPGEGWQAKKRIWWGPFVERMSGLVCGCRGRGRPSLTFGWCECVREGTVVFLFLGRTLGRLRLALELVFVELRWEVVVVL